MKLVNVRTIIYTDTIVTVVSYYSTNEILKCFIEHIYNTGIKVYLLVITRIHSRATVYSTYACYFTAIS